MPKALTSVELINLVREICRIFKRKETKFKYSNIIKRGLGFFIDIFKVGHNRAKKKKKKKSEKNDIYKENEKKIFWELKNFRIQSMSVSEIVTVRDGQDQVNASVQ